MTIMMVKSTVMMTTMTVLMVKDEEYHMTVFMMLMMTMHDLRCRLPRVIMHV